MKRVSVVIPVYNGRNYLTAALDSVKAQDYPNIDITVISSPDSTEDISDLCTGIKLIPGKSGVVPNWQTALDAATGDYVKLLCHDDTLRKDCISRQVAALEADKTLSFVTCQKQWIDKDGNNDGVMILETSDKYIKGSDLTKLILTYGNIIGETSTALWRNTKFDFPKDLNWLADIYMWITLASKGNYLYIADLLTSIRLHPEQGTHTCLKDTQYLEKEMSDKQHILNLAVNKGLIT